MKKLILFICLFVSFSAAAQFLSLKDLMKLQKKNLTEAQEYLADRDWKFNNAHKTKENKMAQVSFVYKRNKLALKKAQGWLRYTYDEKKEIVRIIYEIYNSEKFNDFVSDLKSKDFLLANTEAKDGKLISTYHNNDYYIILKSIKIEDPVTASVRYEIALKSTADYLNSKQKNN